MRMEDPLGSIHKVHQTFKEDVMPDVSSAKQMFY